MSSINNHIAQNIKELPMIPTPRRAAGYIRLDLNESPSLLPRKALANITLTAEDMGYYPEYDTLKQKLATSNNVDESNVTVYNGSDAAIATLLNVFFKESDTVVLPEPSFFIYRQLLTAHKAHIRSIPISRVDEEVSFPTERILEAMTNDVKGVLLCNPTNPTGIAIPPDDLEAIMAQAAKTNTLVVVDEAYFEFYGKTVADKVATHANVIVLRTLSKGYGLAGLRVGYSITHPDVTQYIGRLQLPWSASSISTMIAEKVLYEHQDTIANARQALLARKTILEQHLQSLHITYAPSHTNFLLVTLPDAAAFAEAMYTQKVIVGKTYLAADKYPVLANTVRLTVPSPEDMSYVTEAIKKCYANTT